MNHPHSYNIFSLGDSAITVEFGNVIDEQVNQTIIVLFDQLSQHPIRGIKEIVPAYHTLTFYFDIVAARKLAPAEQAVHEWMKSQIEQRIDRPLEITAGEDSEMRIPVCYDALFAPDIEQLARSRDISVEEVIAIHTAPAYRVYMLGFLPGFAYLGRVDERIAVGRKQQPVHVAAGSVGIAGIQTGIYPLASPGGWQIIGRTPLSLFNINSEQPTLLKAGDTVRFFPISTHEFANY